MTKPKIRLLCVGRALYGGGAERVQLTMLKHLDRRKFDIKLFYLRRHADLQELVPQDVMHSNGVNGNESLKLHFLSVNWRLIKLAKQSDLILAMQDGPPIYLSVLAGYLTNRPVIGWIHAPWSELLLTSPRWHRRASSTLYNKTDSLIAVSRGAADDLASVFPHLASKIVVCSNPIALAAIRLDAEARLPDWATGIFRKRTILAAGRLAAEKGFDVLIAAFRQLVDDDFDCNLLILGEGEERAPLEAMTQRLQLGERVFMPGFQKNPYPYFKRAEVFVLSSRFESMGMVTVEAMALGVPVVVTDCSHGVLREVVQNGRCGVLVRVDDARDLAEGLQQLMESGERRETLRIAGRERAKDFDLAQTLKPFEDVITSCAARHSTWQANP